ncbi:hypothetical protein [Aquimarina aquimarini]|uniref:hypothetical protein n=2 Tax=Aquimarina aquimarini TaxID=1191734 RepID=UPI001F33BDF2|nr:hypothetical protein [Aquimarina aquimarini]
MKEWLVRIRPPKYLRYFFYIAYSWYRGYKSERNEAHATAIVLLWFVHTPLLLRVLHAFNKGIILELNEYQTVYPIAIITGLLFYYLFWYQGKWRIYVEEFKHFKKKDRRKGTVYLFIYLLICTLISFDYIFFY